MFRVSLIGALAGSGAVFGLVWVGRLFRRRAAELDEVRPEAKPLLPAEVPAEMLDVDSSLDFDAVLEDESESTDAFDTGPTYNIDVDVVDEPYDALDAEDVGTEWLLRATQTTMPVRKEPDEFRGGIPIEASEEATHAENEAGFGSDQHGAPLAPRAGTHEADVAAELPVGNVDAEGNTELHAPVNPPDAFRAPPTGELSVSERELAARKTPPYPSRR